MAHARGLVEWAAAPQAGVQVVALAHAPAGAAPFRPWTLAMEGRAGLSAVRLPGRESRASEAPLDTMEGVVTEVEQLIGTLAGPIALFGHCAGASAMLEVAYRLAAAGCPPVSLFVAAQASPRARVKVAQGGDPDLIALLRGGGTPMAVLNDPDLLAMILPILEAEERLMRRYEYRSRPKLKIPITCYCAAGDPDVSREAALLWGEETEEHFRLRTFRDDHLLHASWEALATDIVATVEAAVS